MTLSNILAHIDVIWDSADAVESCWQLGLACVPISHRAVAAACMGFRESPTTLLHTQTARVTIRSTSRALQML